jgi:hypothetical protein
VKQLNLIARRRRNFGALRVLADASIRQRQILEGDSLDRPIARLQFIRIVSLKAEQVARDYYASLQ